MEFLKYQHVERWGSSEVEGIELGTCYVFSKIDGTNSQVFLDDRGQIKAGSRNRELTLEKDNAGFYAEILKDEKIKKLLYSHPKLRIYGEFLIPHTLKTYTKDSWRKFYVFDVMFEDEYIPYESYKILLDAYGIEYIPPICIITNPTYEQLINQLDKANYLIEDGKGSGEGIVIKNYNYVNKYGRVTWAKIVTNEFKATKARCEPTELKGAKMVEEEIAKKYVTDVLVEKEYSKIINDNDGWTSKNIPQLLNTVYHCVIKEELWDALKTFKNPTINFKTLQHFVTVRIKLLKPELF